MPELSDGRKEIGGKSTDYEAVSTVGNEKFSPR
jgi:hypothetical protein